MARVVWGLITFFLLLAVSPVSEAGSTCPGYQSGLDWCAGHEAKIGTSYQSGECIITKVGSTSWQFRWDYVGMNGSHSSFVFDASCPADFDPNGEICAARPPVSMGAWDGYTTSVEFEGCMYELDNFGDGVTRVCVPGFCTGSAMWRPTGEVGPSGSPSPEPPDPPPAASACNYGSCYEPETDEFCAVGSGGRVCVPAKPPSGSGGCISMGDTTLCSGTPPPSPPNPPVGDPPSQLASSDKYQVQRGLDSPVASVTVNNYNTEGKVPDNGAGEGDGGKPRAPEAGTDKQEKEGDGTSAGGGGDCNTPPICEGAAATCMVVTQTYLLRCPPGGGGGSNDADTTVPGLDDIGEGPGEGFIREETLLDKLDVGGFGGGGQCPSFVVLDLDKWGIHMDGTSVEWCDLLEKAGYVLMMIAAFISLRILSEK